MIEDSEQDDEFDANPKLFGEPTSSRQQRQIDGLIETQRSSIKDKQDSEVRSSARLLKSLAMRKTVSCALPGTDQSDRV